MTDKTDDEGKKPRIVKRSSVKKPITGRRLNKKKVAPKKAPAKKAAKRKVAKKKAKPLALVVTMPRDQKISDIDKIFVDNYVGSKDNPLAIGNAKACYKLTHPKAGDATAETEGPKILRKPQVQEYLGLKLRTIEEDTNINAQWVLEKSVELFETCMGQRTFVETISVDVPETVEDSDVTIMTKKTVEIEKKEFNPSSAGKALELIGKNICVNAFADKIDVTGTFDLAAIMAKAQARVEKAFLGDKT